MKLSSTYIIEEFCRGQKGPWICVKTKICGGKNNLCACLWPVSRYCELILNFIFFIPKYHRYRLFIVPAGGGSSARFGDFLKNSGVTLGVLFGKLWRHSSSDLVIISRKLQEYLLKDHYNSFIFFFFCRTPRFPDGISKI